ncbi:uncharacterized protein METZ01_LOCUS190232 [marine metagenome]|uniref:Uncharacterized protein n=1 Tax=marine metagenome TaxID=408172 RepID=A0A382DG61_9ZZZZ
MVWAKWQQRYHPGSFYSSGKDSLMQRAGAGLAAGIYFRSIRHKSPEATHIFIIYVCNLLYTKSAYLTTSYKSTSWPNPSISLGMTSHELVSYN